MTADANAKTQSVLLLINTSTMMNANVNATSRMYLAV